MVISTPYLPDVHPTFIVKYQTLQALYQPTTKKVTTPTELRELQVPMLCCLTNVSFIEDFSKIWRALDLLYKDKTRPALDIYFCTHGRYLRCKFPRITYPAVFLLLGISYHIENPD